MNRTFAIGRLAVCLALFGAGCSRSPRVTFYTLEPAAGLESAAGMTATPARAAVAAAPAALPPTSTAAAPPTSAATSLAAKAAVPRAEATTARETPGVPGASARGAASTTPASSAPAAAAAAAANVDAATAAASVVVGPVTLPELVDRPQLVVRVAPNRVAILESERWAEPLRSQIPRVIAEDLGRLLGSSQVASYLQHSEAEAGCRVLLDIERFEAAPGEAVSIEAVWSLRRAAGGVPVTGRSRVREAAAGEGYDALVAAYGRALLGVSADLARAIRAEGAGGR